MAADTARAFSTGVNEGLASFAFEIRDAGLIDLEIDRGVENEPEHETFGIKAGAAEQALHRHRTELREQFADEVGIQAGNPSLRAQPPAGAGLEAIFELFAPRIRQALHYKVR